MISELARGEVGLIVSSHTFVSPEGQAGRWRLAVCDDRFIGGLSQMTKVAHEGEAGRVATCPRRAQAETSLTKLEAVGPSSLTEGKELAVEP